MGNLPVKWGVCQASHDLCLQQTSEIPCHTYQISFVEKFKKFGRKYEISCSQSFVFDYI